MAMAEGRFRVGFLCNDGPLQRWQAEVVRALATIPQVELVVVVKDATVHRQRSLLSRILRYPWRTALYRAYRDRAAGPRAMRRVQDGPLAHVPELRCTPQRTGAIDRFERKDLDAIAAFRPDVLMRFGFNILKGGILDLPKHGVWSFHHGDPTRFRGGPPALWEILRNEPITGAVLQRLTDDLDAGRILRQGWFSTIDHSLAETVDTVLLQSAIWPAQVIREFLGGNMTAVDGSPPAEKGRLYRYPRNLTFLRFLWKQFANKARFHRQEMNVHEEWNLGILYQPITSLLDPHASVNIRWLPAPAMSTFRADPFGYMGPDGRLNVLYEKYDHATGRGEIARVRPKADNILKRSRTMLKVDGHLSYPYVVQQAGTTYVIPESAEEGRVVLYKVNDANDELERVRVLLEEPLFDPTVVAHEGRWWLFGTKAPLTNVKLYAYHSERLEGPYLPHALNPIKFDIRSARPAGTPFRRGDELWRPAQDSSLTYGGRIAMNRVLELTPDRFREETVLHVEPFRNTVYSGGLHTVSAIG
ncbi:MAG: hypothetical protein KDB84_08860, partial [Flavobacteriales bacterium]|nr:hypothetical protein [Flavobacteriales bacterium]